MQAAGLKHRRPASANKDAALDRTHPHHVAFAHQHFVQLDGFGSFSSRCFRIAVWKSGLRVPWSHRLMGIIVVRAPEPVIEVAEPVREITISSTIQRMLKGVLAPGGTGAEAKVPGYELAGKTGTANKVDEKTGLYSESRYIASFVGFAPAGTLTVATPSCCCSCC